MKRKRISFFTFLLVVLFSLCGFSCKEEKVDPVVIDLNGRTVAANATLLDVMEELQAEGSLTLTIENGMITGLNGVKNSVIAKSYWMLYTTDEENSNTAWGTYTYEGQVLASSTYGAEELLAKENELYVWVYTKV